LTTLAGAPTATTRNGMFLATTELAPKDFLNKGCNPKHVYTQRIDTANRQNTGAV
jgi:hypothetical protein